MDNISSIEFFFEEVHIPGFDDTAIRKWVEESIEAENQQPGILNIIFCNDDYLLDLNKQYLNHHTLTDIITFDYAEEMEGVSGDIFISTDRVSDNASELNISFHDELCRVIIHGILHLMGYKDKTQAQKTLMRDKENYYLTLRS